MSALKARQSNSFYAVKSLATRILLVRGVKVMLDTTLANLYGVETKTLNQAVKRNLSRFPSDFMFQLSWEETENLRSQMVILNPPDAKASRSQTVNLIERLEC